MGDPHAALAVACRERGIIGPAAFHARFGIVPAALTAHAALVLVETPEWVTATWLPNAGRTRVVWVPQAVRTYAAVFSVHQRGDESDHDFVLRIQTTIR